MVIPKDTEQKMYRQDAQLKQNSCSQHLRGLCKNISLSNAWILIGTLFETKNRVLGWGMAYW